MDPSPELSVELPATPESIRRARALVDRIAGEVPEGTDLWGVRLLLSELVTNAVRHGAGGSSSSDDVVGVRVAVRDGALRIEVRNRGGGFAPLPRVDGQALGSGWGLHFVAELAREWGVEEDGGTLVWAEVPLAGDGRGGGLATPRVCENDAEGERRAPS